MNPSEACRIINEKRVFQNLYENALYSKPKKAKLRIGDKVRVNINEKFSTRVTRQIGPKKSLLSMKY